MIDQYLNYIQEKQNPEVELFRKRNKYMYFYHGTPGNYIEQIKKTGLDPRRMEVYSTDIRHKDFHKGSKYFNKKVLWLTTRKVFAKAFIKKPFINGKFTLKTKRGEVVLVKVETKYTDYLDPKKLEQRLRDEYVYTKKILPKDIVWPGDPRYIKIEKTYKYLSQKKFFNRFGTIGLG